MDERSIFYILRLNMFEWYLCTSHQVKCFQSPCPRAFAGGTAWWRGPGPSNFASETVVRWKKLNAPWAKQKKNVDVFCIVVYPCQNLACTWQFQWLGDSDDMLTVELKQTLLHGQSPHLLIAQAFRCSKVYRWKTNNYGFVRKNRGTWNGWYFRIFIMIFAIQTPIGWDILYIEPSG